MYRSSRPHLVFLGAIALLMVLAPTLSAPVEAQGPVCEGYSGKSLIRGFGGPARFSKQPVTSPDDLLRFLRDHESEVRSVMESQGVGDLTDDLLHAVETGQGLSERNVRPGEKYEWMAFRKKGQPVVIENTCFSPRKGKTYDAYVVELYEEGEPTGPECNQVTTTHYDFVMPKICVNLALTNVRRETETLPPIPPPVCELTASRSGDPSRQISVDATGSSEEVAVTLDGETILPAGASPKTWSGRDENPYQEVVAVARGENQDRCGRTQRCEETVRLEPYVRPSCVITIDPEGELSAGQDFTLNVDGDWRANGLEVTVRRGDRVVREISHDSTGPLSEEMSLRPGDYVIEGVATNVIDDEATCQAEVAVRSRWKIRPHATYWDLDDDLIMFTGTNAVGAPVREKFQLGDGFGFGVGLEYYFTDRVGLEGELEVAEIDSTFLFDLGNDWELDEDDAETFGLFLGPNFHLTPNRNVDFYLGPLVGLVDVGSVDFETLGVNTEASVDSEFVWGARVGLDVPFAAESPWAFNASARWLDFSPEITLSNSAIVETFDRDVDPITLSVGLAYSF